MAAGKPRALCDFDRLGHVLWTVRFPQLPDAHAPRGVALDGPHHARGDAAPDMALPIRPRTLLRLYPRAWRDRYGNEFVALLEKEGTGPRVVLSVLAGAFDAW